MNIQSPAANHTVGTTFKVVGTYTPPPGTRIVQARLCPAGGGACGPWVNGTLMIKRPVWHVDFAAIAPGTYTVEAQILDGGVLVDGPASVAGVKVEAAPKLTLAQPAHLADPGGLSVVVEADMTTPHLFTSIDLRLYSQAGVSESGFSMALRSTTSVVGPHPLTGAAGDAHYVVATATEAGGATTIASVGGVRLT